MTPHHAATESDEALAKVIREAWWGSSPSFTSKLRMSLAARSLAIAAAVRQHLAGEQATEMAALREENARLLGWLREMDRINSDWDDAYVERVERIEWTAHDEAVTQELRKRLPVWGGTEVTLGAFRATEPPQDAQTAALAERPQTRDIRAVLEEASQRFVETRGNPNQRGLEIEFWWYLARAVQSLLAPPTPPAGAANREVG